MCPAELRTQSGAQGWGCTLGCLLPTAAVPEGRQGCGKGFCVLIPRAAAWRCWDAGQVTVLGRRMERCCAGARSEHGCVLHLQMPRAD